MDEVLEIVDVFADSGFESVLSWALRLLGILVVVAGLGLWLFTDMGIFILPALLIVVGLVLLAVPGLLLGLLELAG
ncbi:MAG: hypothetical protein ABEJ58_05675 [Halodesulfurarchaeum sp.]